MPSQQLAAKYGHIRFLPCPGRTEILSKFRAISGIVCKTRSPTLPKSAKVKLSWTLANFDRVDTPLLQAFRMSTGIFARSRARPGPTKNPTYPHILGHSARPPFRKLAKVELICITARPIRCDLIAHKP